VTLPSLRSHSCEGFEQRDKALHRDVRAGGRDDPPWHPRNLGPRPEHLVVDTNGDDCHTRLLDAELLGDVTTGGRGHRYDARDLSRDPFLHPDKAVPAVQGYSPRKRACM
jgi:hypothetical protein